ncbi:MAG: hypothetical protein QN120_05865 [Armatimonadota bacterium]|nr:hypothetical protein [Armatimonadota bacterium]
MRETLTLPEGYRIQEAGEDVRLYGPRGVLLQEVRRGQAAADTLAARAWQEAWRDVERELTDEVRAFRQGHRPLRTLKRLRQYFRMLDALERPPVDLHAEVHRNRMAAGLAMVASAVLMAVTLLATQPWRAAGPGQPPQDGRPTPAGPGIARRPANRIPAPAADKRAHRRAPDQARGAAPRDRVGGAVHPKRTARAPAARSPMRRYVVSFGEFASQAAAEVSMRLIRSKGYVVHVMRIGGSYHVITGPRERTDAERLAGALQEIGLPARAQPISTVQM